MYFLLSKFHIRKRVTINSIKKFIHEKTNRLDIETMIVEKQDITIEYIILLIINLETFFFFSINNSYK